jgi:hypothetical protein
VDSQALSACVLIVLGSQALLACVRIVNGVVVALADVVGPAYGLLGDLLLQLLESTATVCGSIVVEASSLEEAEEIAIREAMSGGGSVLWVAVGALGPITAPVIYNYDTGRRVRP